MAVNGTAWQGMLVCVPRAGGGTRVSTWACDAGAHLMQVVAFPVQAGILDRRHLAHAVLVRWCLQAPVDLMVRAPLLVYGGVWCIVGLLCGPTCCASPCYTPLRLQWRLPPSALSFNSVL
jgi:hypothetical protein